MNFSGLQSYSPHTLLLWWRALFLIVAIGVACSSRDNEVFGLRQASTSSNDAPVIEAHNRDNYDDTLKRLRGAAVAGDPAAQELLGILLLGGSAVLQFSGVRGRQNCEALAWFDRAADQGGQVGRGYRDSLSRTELSYARRYCLPIED